jgi:hypothetical protein
MPITQETMPMAMIDPDKLESLLEEDQTVKRTENPSAVLLSKALKFFIFAAVGAFFVWLSVSAKNGNVINPNKPEPDEDIARRIAAQHVKQVLSNPDAAKIKATKLLAADKLYYMFQVLIDAQNAFGATVRENFCVTVRINSNRTSYTYNEKYSIQKCSNPPSEDEIKVLRDLNDWGADINETKVKTDTRLEPE